MGIRVRRERIGRELEVHHQEREVVAESERVGYGFVLPEATEMTVAPKLQNSRAQRKVKKRRKLQKAVE